jgi:hypothetical protein
MRKFGWVLLVLGVISVIWWAIAHWLLGLGIRPYSPLPLIFDALLVFFGWWMVAGKRNIILFVISILVLIYWIYIFFLDTFVGFPLF